MGQPTRHNHAAAPDWQPCPKGTFASLSGTLAGRRNRRLFLRTAAFAAAGLVTGGAGLWWLLNGNAQEGPLRGLSCGEAQRLADALVRDELSEIERERVLAHVRECPNCQPCFRALGINV